MTAKVLPLSWLKRFFTFSSMNALGRFAFRMRQMSKKSVPRVLSSKPVARPRLLFFDTPAMENGWQGNPATSTS